MTNRKPPRALNKSAADVAVNAAAERARKAASRAALKAAKQQPPAAEQNRPAPADPSSTQADEAAARAERAVQDAANALIALRVDFEALMAEGADHAADTPESVEAAFAAFLAEQGVSPDGSPIPEDPASKAQYRGPMLALRAAAKQYVKAANGQPCNGDDLATALWSATREETVAVLVAAMKLPSNPYSHLNPGQQSMNLRNKARGQIKNGMLLLGQITATLDAFRSSK